MANKKLAECLLRRKELQEKLSRMGQIHARDLFVPKVERLAVGDGRTHEELRANMPKVTFAQVDAEYNHYAMQLRLIDGAIQQKNWTAEVEDIDQCFLDFTVEETK